MHNDFVLSFVIALFISVLLYNKHFFCKNPFDQKKCSNIMCKFSSSCSRSRFRPDAIDEEDHHD